MILRWDKHFMSMAKLASTMSKDPSTKVGAILVRDRRVVGTGYNGFPKGIGDSEVRLNDRELKYEMIIHAEMNALLDAGEKTSGTTLYIYGFDGPPCCNCTKHVIQAGVREIVVTGKPIPKRWSGNFGLSRDMLREAGIELRSLPVEET